MGLIKSTKQILRTVKVLPDVFRYGGITNVSVSKIDYHGGMFSENDLVLITGGGSGIGFAMAKRFIEEGASVVITGRNNEKLNKAKQNMGSGNLYTIEWDASDIGIIPSKFKEIEGITGKRVSILINNAGTYAKTHFPNTTSEDWDFVYNTNLKSLYFISQYFVREYCKQNFSMRVNKIINISSQGGMVPANNAYRMTKWDIRGFTKYLGKCYASKGIIANAIAPGIILTDMQPELKKQGDNLYTTLNPSKRAGLPEEIAELALFLASNASNFIVGQTICCDGGYSI